MIKAVIRGGLGNQLFQYASAYALARRLNQPLVLDASFYPKQTLRGFRLGCFHLSEHEVSERNDCMAEALYKQKMVNGLIRRTNFSTLPYKRGKYLIDHAGKFTPGFFTINAKNVFLNGYFQSEEYFAECRDELLKQLTPNYEPEPSYQEVLEAIRNSNSVAVHVRRGDFVGDASKFHYVLDAGYYENAICTMRKSVEEPSFFCFSDDIDWVKEQIRQTEDFQFVSLKTSHADIDEMMLMKSCKHIITANSTFSWWAAWLNENESAIRIVPDRPYGNDKMIPKGWMRLA